MNRVMIIGAPGSGKSTLARLLAERTGLPLFHMDHIHWQAGWVERAEEEKNRLTREVHARERWIFEGGYSRTWPERLERADTLLWLDVPVGLRLWRILSRAIVYFGRPNPGLPQGCVENFDRQMLEFLRYVVFTRRRARAKMRALYEDAPSHVSAYRFTTLSDVNAFLATLPEAGESGCRSV